MTARAWLARFDEFDRRVFRRWAALGTGSHATRAFWRAVTRFGGPVFTVAASTLPFLLGGAFAEGARRAVMVLVGSTVVVQLVKRIVGRLRPSRAVGHVTSIREPDRFSFPSGHSASAMSVAVAYTFTFPHLAPALLPAALLVGVSRVALGVHYPSDVLFGEVIALVSAGAVLPWTGSP